MRSELGRGDRRDRRDLKDLRPSVALAAGLAFLGGCAAPKTLPYEVKTVPAAAETAPMTGRGDRADDPAFWHNPLRFDESLILGTNKDEGLYVYNLAGEEKQMLPVGRVNNVDLRGRIAVASNDEVNGLSWFRVDARLGSSGVTHLGDTPVERNEPYGVCLGIVASRTVAGVTFKDGTIELWQLHSSDDGALSASLQRSISLRSQLEGCVFDDAEERLFIGEEGTGIWSLELADESSNPVLVDSIEAGNGLRADVEGLSLYLDPDGGGYLVASAQSADRFVVYDRLPPHRVRGAFTISESADGTVDAVTHTDGLDVSATPLPNYPRGVLIVQDDGNPRSGVDQNFKLIDWRAVEEALSLAD